MASKLPQPRDDAPHRVRPPSVAGARHPLLLAAGCFVLVVAVGAILIRQAEEIDRGAQRAAALNLASGAGYTLEQQLSRSLSATFAMAALIRREGDIAGFGELAAEMLPLYTGASALVLAPGGVIREIWPPVEGKGVIGLDLLRAPDRATEARSAVTSRQLTLGGPFELKQGGLGMVGRLPVFAPAPGGGDRFWGLANVIVRLPDLLVASGIHRLGEAGYDWTLSRVPQETGKRVVFAGSGPSALPAPVTMAVKVPNGEWTLAVAPRGGWRTSPVRRMGYPITLAVAAAVAMLAWRVLRVPTILRREVAARTADLAEANRALAADNAERQRAEEALRLTQFAVDHASEAIVWSDETGTVRYLNDAGTRLVGRARADLVGLKIWEVDRTLTEASWRAAYDEAARSGALTLEATWPRPPPAGPRSVESTLARLVLGDQVLNVAFLRDVTAQRRTEEQLRHSQKMEAIGQLAGGVAHDFNNLLTGILGYASLLADKGEPGSVAAEAGQIILEAGERAAALTRQLLGLARRGKFRNAPVDVHEVVGEVIRFLARTVDKSIALEQRFEAEGAVVIGDAGQIHQVLLNLAVNARDAMPRGGVMTFETEEVSVSAGEERGELEPGRYLAVSVRDTGEGIPREIRERIFEPFFTTKAQGKGTGLGLATVYGIARNHGGSVSLESEPGRGTVFTVKLPLAETGRARASGEEKRGVPRGSGRVLVVDDEPVVRAATGRMLRELGYEPVVSSSAGEAVTTYRASRGDIDLVLLDIAMPGMDGRACLQALREADPGVRVVLSSGYTSDGRAQEMLGEGAAGFVQKPYQVRELAESLERALRKERPAAILP